MDSWARRHSGRDRRGRQLAHSFRRCVPGTDQHLRPRSVLARDAGLLPEQGTSRNGPHLRRQSDGRAGTNHRSEALYAARVPISRIESAPVRRLCGRRGTARRRATPVGHAPVAVRERVGFLLFPGAIPRLVGNGPLPYTRRKFALRPARSRLRRDGRRRAGLQAGPRGERRRADRGDHHPGPAVGRGSDHRAGRGRLGRPEPHADISGLPVSTSVDRFRAAGLVSVRPAPRRLADLGADADRRLFRSSPGRRGGIGGSSDRRRGAVSRPAGDLGRACRAHRTGRRVDRNPRCTEFPGLGTPRRHVSGDSAMAAGSDHRLASPRPRSGCLGGRAARGLPHPGRRRRRDDRPARAAPPPAVVRLGDQCRGVRLGVSVLRGGWRIGRLSVDLGSIGRVAVGRGDSAWERVATDGGDRRRRADCRLAVVRRSGSPANGL